MWLPITPMPTMPMDRTGCSSSPRPPSPAKPMGLPPRPATMPRQRRAHVRERSGLKEPLERLYREFDWEARAARDAIRYPLRYTDPGDREVVALLASCLAYGRVDLFGSRVDWILARMGPSPRAFVLGFDANRDGAAFEGFRYRFNRPPDLVAFCLSGRRLLEAHGSLGACFATGYAHEHENVGPALERFVSGFLDGDLSAVFP